MKRSNQVGYAVLGIGEIAQAAVLPAFRNAKKNSRLVALISGDRAKREILGRRYGVDTYDTKDLAHVLERQDVDAIYIATPNAAHLEPVVQAAERGVHVLLEKPMAVSPRECLTMLRACDGHGVQLMIAYRLHFEPMNLAALKLARQGRLGELRYFHSEFSYQLRAEDIRSSRRLGGGAIWDLGPYCVNAARTFFRAEPLEVQAFAIPGPDARFAEVPAGWTAVLRFPGDRVANFTCSFDAAAVDSYRLVGTKGDLQIENAYEYVGPRHWVLTVGGQSRRRVFPETDHFAPELLYFSRCIREDRKPEPSGAEGLADVRVLEAIVQAAQTGRRVAISGAVKTRHPSPGQVIVEPAVEAPPLVHAALPHRN